MLAIVLILLFVVFNIESSSNPNIDIDTRLYIAKEDLKEIEIWNNKKRRFSRIAIYVIISIPLTGYIYYKINELEIIPITSLATIILSLYIQIKIFAKLSNLLKYDKLIKKAKLKIENMEEYSKETEKKKSNQEDLAEILKNHLVWEHGYDEAKLECKTSEYLIKLMEDKE